MAAERPDPLRLRLLARLVERDVDPLQEVRARLAEEDDGLGGLDLGEEQRMPSPFPPPVAQQLHGGAGHPAFAAQGQGPPFGELGADAADQLQLDRCPDPLVLRRLAPRWPVEVHGRTPARPPLRRIELRDPPVRFRLLEGRVEDGFRDFVRVHGSVPKARQIASSFSVTSGWTSSGSINAAISW